MDACDVKYGPRLCMTLCSVSSEDESHRADVLRMHARHSAGWQSSKLCSYPQTLIFRFDGQVYVDYLRLLVHESKIASCVDVCVADARSAELASGVCGSCEAAFYSRLGHVRFATNEQSHYRARELKTINVQRRCVYLKLLLRRPHSNPYNVFGQVGVVALTAHGTVLRPLNAWLGCTLAVRVGEFADVPLEEMRPLTVARAASVVDGDGVDNNNNNSDNGDDRGGGGGSNSGSRHAAAAAATPPREAKKRNDDDGNHTSNDKDGNDDNNRSSSSGGGGGGRAVVANALRLSSASTSSLASAALSRRLGELRAMKQRAVVDEDYDLADAIKTQLSQLEGAVTRLRELEAAKAAAVAAEDYRRAKELKLSMDELLRLGYQPPALLCAQHTHPATSSSAATTSLPPSALVVAAHEHSCAGEGGDDGGRRGVVVGSRRGNAHDEVPVGVAGGSAEAHGSHATPTVAAAAPSAAVRRHDTVTPTPSSSAAAAAVAAPAMPLASDGLAWEVAFRRVLADMTGEQQQQQQQQQTNMATSPVSLPEARMTTELARFVRVFGRYGTACLFSRRGALREAVLRAAVSPAGFAALCSNTAVTATTVADELLAYVAMKGNGVGDAVAGVVFASCAAVLQLLRGSLAGAPAPSQLSASLTRLLPELVARLGDANHRVRDAVVAVVLVLADAPLGAAVVVQALASDVLAAVQARVGSASGGGSGGTTTLPTRALLTRLGVATRLVDSGGARVRDDDALQSQLLDGLVQPCLQHANADVRAAAALLFARTAMRLPRGVCNAFLEQLKPAQRAMVQQQMQKTAAQQQQQQQHRNNNNDDDDDDGGGGGGGGEVGNDVEDGRADMVAVSMSVHDVRLPSPHTTTPQEGNGRREKTSEGVITAARDNKARHDGDDDDDTDDSAERALHTCQFCNEYNAHFTEASLDVHYVRACPMLCPCPLCDQVTEISMLQQHLISECEGRALVRECPRCHEAVQAEDYKSHVAAQTCIKAVTTHSVCPLCHARFRSGMEGWRRHLAAAPGCVNNPRKYDGTGPYERAA